MANTKSCVKVEVAVLGSQSLIRLMVSVDVKYHERRRHEVRVQEPCEQGGGPGLSFPIPLFPPSLISRTVSEDVKHHDGP